MLRSQQMKYLFPLNGVGTTMRYTSAEIGFVDAFKPFETAFETITSKSGSTICIFLDL